MNMIHQKVASALVSGQFEQAQAHLFVLNSNTNASGYPFAPVRTTVEQVVQGQPVPVESQAKSSGEFAELKRTVSHLQSQVSVEQANFRNSIGATTQNN